MLNARLGRLADRQGAVFQGGKVSIEDELDFDRSASIELTTKPVHWRETLSIAERELRRALQFGFTASELKEAVAGARQQMDEAVRSASTRASGSLADGLVNSVIDRQVFTAPTYDRDMLGPVLDKVTPLDCLTALREAWPESRPRRVYIAGNVSIPGNEGAVIGAYQTSVAQAVRPAAERAVGTFAYTDFGPPGKVVSRQYVEDLDITEIQFGNGVRLNIKPTTFEKGVAHISARVGGGLLSVPREHPELVPLARRAFLAGGLGKHKAEDLERILAGHSLSEDFAVDGDAFVLSGSTSPQDLGLELDVLCAQVGDPGYRVDALRDFRQSVRDLFAKSAHDVEGPIDLEAERLFANGDMRFGLAPEVALLKVGMPELKQWLAPELTSGAIEIAIVGDVDPDAAIAQVARTFGTLPTRSPRPDYTTERRVNYSPVPVLKSYTVDSAIARSMISIRWPATDNLDPHVSRRLGVASRRIRRSAARDAARAHGGYVQPGCIHGPQLYIPALRRD